MPHLSPMNWLIAPIIFSLLTLPFLISYLWWSQTPSFPLILKGNNQNNSTMWNWN